MTEYLITICRDLGNRRIRAEKAKQVHSLVTAFEGVTCLSAKADPTIIVNATPEAAARLKEAVGEGVWIEMRPELPGGQPPSLSL